MAGLGGAFPLATAGFSTGIGEKVMEPIGALSNSATKVGLDTFTNLDPNSQEYKNYQEAGSQILPMVATV
jgi:hypothetical protein